MFEPSEHLWQVWVLILKVILLLLHRRAERSYSMVRRGSGEETSLVQVKEQGLHFAGAAVKSYPTSKVRETK